MKKISLLFLGMLLTAGNALAGIKATAVEYSFSGIPLEGYVAYDDTKTAPAPAILIVPDWMGLRDFDKAKAEELAKQGFVAFAVDIYGKKMRPKNTDEAAKLAGFYKSNRKALRDRIHAALTQLTSMKEVNAKKVVVMGYCFGGTTALELARSGAPIVGAASFHGGLATPTPKDAKNIKGRVLVMHGADDPFVPAAEVAAFKDEMKKAKVKMEFISYKGAVHSFTHTDAGNDNSKGAAYNAAADKKSWEDFQKFLKEILL